MVDVVLGTFDWQQREEQIADRPTTCGHRHRDTTATTTTDATASPGSDYALIAVIDLLHVSWGMCIYHQLAFRILGTILIACFESVIQDILNDLP